MNSERTWKWPLFWKKENHLPKPAFFGDSMRSIFNISDALTVCSIWNMKWVCSMLYLEPNEHKNWRCALFTDLVSSLDAQNNSRASRTLWLKITTRLCSLTMFGVISMICWGRCASSRKVLHHGYPGQKAALPKTRTRPSCCVRWWEWKHTDAILATFTKRVGTCTLHGETWMFIVLGLFPLTSLENGYGWKTTFLVGWLPGKYASVMLVSGGVDHTLWWCLSHVPWKSKTIKNNSPPELLIINLY